jgi:CheY-like chemotaxis protein
MVQRKKIIIAEDHDDHRFLCALACEREGFEVLQAADGRELVELVRQQKASGDLQRVVLVTSDIMMPDLTGLDALEALRCEGVELPFLFVSALGDHETRARACAPLACSSSRSISSFCGGFCASLSPTTPNEARRPRATKGRSREPALPSRRSPPLRLTPRPARRAHDAAPGASGP